MQIDLTQKLKDTDGKDSVGNFKLVDENGVATQEIRPYTLKDSFKTILLARTPDMEESLESDLDDVEISDVAAKATARKIANFEKRYDLFLKIRDADNIEFTKEESDLICELSVSKLTILFAGQIIKIIKQD